MHPRTAARGFTLLELMVTVAITGIIVALAARAIVVTDRGRKLREATADAQGEGRAGLAFMAEDLRVASLGAGTGTIWTEKGATPQRRPAVQIFEDVGGDGFLEAKRGTDAILVVRAAPGASTVLVGDRSETNMPFAVTDAAGFTPSDRILLGEYDDAVFIPLSNVDVATGTLTPNLAANVLPGEHATKVAAGSLVRRARARLYYVDRSDRLIQAELSVPYGPAEVQVLDRHAISEGVENLQITCTVDGGGGPAPCPAPLPAGNAVTDEADAALGPVAGGARLDTGSVSTLRTITLRLAVRSRPMRDATEAGDPPIAIEGVTLPAADPPGLHYARRAYEVELAVRNTSLGAL